MLKAPNQRATSALISFVPRQVMLDSKSKRAAAAVDLNIKNEQMAEEGKTKKKKNLKSKPLETLENGSNESKTLELGDDGPKRNSRRRLLSSFAAFMESNGFHKSLAAFRSEAEVESIGLETSSIDLEDLFYKFLESSGVHEEAAINCQTERDTQKPDASNKDDIEHTCDISNQMLKKIRKHKKQPDDGTNTWSGGNTLDKATNGLNDLANANDLDKLKSSEDSRAEIKDKKKKKKKKTASASLDEEVDGKYLENNSGVPEDGDANDKARKKKKHKDSSNGHEGSTGSEDLTEFQETVEEKVTELKCLTNLSDQPAVSNTKHKSKNKKEKKIEAITDSLAVDGSKHTEVTREESGSAEEKTVKSENNGNTEKKAHKKRKRLDSKEKTSQEEDETKPNEPKYGELEGAENNMECVVPQEPEKSLQDNEQKTSRKKRKTDKRSQGSEEIAKASRQEEEPARQNVQKEAVANQTAEGELKKNEMEAGTTSKSKKKDKRSGETKTFNAFQRVKIDEVKFADEKLQDNSYWALDDTGSGYGAKAQEVLGQVRGRDFRHEKTKKKRGTYRGGQIDLESHSIKFNYSEEE